MAKSNRALIGGKAGELANLKKICPNIRSLGRSIPNVGIKAALTAAQIQGAVRVICLAGPAGPGARARQAISPLLGLRFAGWFEVD